MRTAVTGLNVISSLASLAMAWFGLVMAEFAAQFNPLQRDYYGIAYGLTVLAIFLILPVLCAVKSQKLARMDRRSSITVSLVPLALAPPAFLMFSAGGLRLLEHTIEGVFGPH